MNKLLLILTLFWHFRAFTQVNIFSYTENGQNISVQRDSMGQDSVIIFKDNNEGSIIHRIVDKGFVINSIHKNDSLCTVMAEGHSLITSQYFWVFKKIDGIWKILNRNSYDIYIVEFQKVEHQFFHPDIFTFEVLEIYMSSKRRYQYIYDGNGNEVVNEIQE